MEFQGQLLYIVQKKRDISKLQGFFYDVFDYIEQIYIVEDHNGYKKRINGLKKEYIRYLKMIYNGYSQ